MALETYRLVVAEMESHEGITVDVYNEDGTIEKTTSVPYEDHGLTTDRDDGTPAAREHEFEADVMTMDLQVARQTGTFEVQVVGDGTQLHSERIADEDWNLVTE